LKEIEHRFSLWDAEVVVRPKLDMHYLYLEITSRCNLNCKMCFKQYWEDKDGDMSSELFMKILEDAEEFPELRMIIFGGIGEPLVHPKFLEMMREVKRRGHALGITTNGTLMSEKIAEEIVKNDVDLVYFSMDSLPTRPELPSLGHLSSIIVDSRIRKLIRLRKSNPSGKPTVSVTVVVTKENYRQLPQMVRYLRDIEVDSVLITNLLPMTEEQTKEIVYDGSVDMDEIVDEIEKIASYGIYVKLPNFKLMTERRCEFDENNAAVVRWDGEVSPCYRFLHTYYEYIFGRKKKVNAYSFGNLREKSLTEIWTSREYSRFRFIMKNYMYPSCTDCPLRDACDFVKTTEVDCWGNTPSCADCLWARRIVMCPVPTYIYGKFL
jgi:tungsten cofactor oxidoreducase radical SAM maturase